MRRNGLQNNTTRSPRSADDPAHEYLRYAVLRLLEGETDETTTNGPESTT